MVGFSRLMPRPIFIGASTNNSIECLFKGGGPIKFLQRKTKYSGGEERGTYQLIHVWKNNVSHHIEMFTDSQIMIISSTL